MEFFSICHRIPRAAFLIIVVLCLPRTEAATAFPNRITASLSPTTHVNVQQRVGENLAFAFEHLDPHTTYECRANIDASFGVYLGMGWHGDVAAPRGGPALRRLLDTEKVEFQTNAQGEPCHAGECGHHLALSVWVARAAPAAFASRAASPVRAVGRQFEYVLVVERVRFGVPESVLPVIAFLVVAVPTALAIAYRTVFRHPRMQALLAAAPPSPRGSHRD